MDFRKLKIGSIVCLGFIIACGNDSYKVLGGQEVSYLFSNNTSEAFHLIQNVKIVSYYSPDGSLHRKKGEIFQKGRWWVDERGRQCLKINDKLRCRFIVVDGDTYYKCKKSKKSGKLEKILIYEKFLNGNVYDL